MAQPYALYFYPTKSGLGNPISDLVIQNVHLVMQTKLVIQSKFGDRKCKFGNPKYKFGNPKYKDCQTILTSYNKIVNLTHNFTIVC